MAVPFHVPVVAAPATSTSPSNAPTAAVVQTATTTNSAPISPQPQLPTSGATTAPHSPLMSPANSEYLVQAFCEALYRYCRASGGSPGYSLTQPPSPSCNEVFFNFNDLRNPQTDDFYGTPRRARSQSFSLPPPRRARFSSLSHHMTDDEDSSDENNIEPNFMEEHYNFLAAREQLQEFSGRVPTQRKNKRDSVNFPQQQHQQNKNKPKEQKFAWPTVVALGVLAVGCGLLATR